MSVAESDHVSEPVWTKSPIANRNSKSSELEMSFIHTITGALQGGKVGGFVFIVTCRP
jgi:hypothetical protein